MPIGPFPAVGAHGDSFGIGGPSTGLVVLCVHNSMACNTMPALFIRCYGAAFYSVNS